MNISVRVVRSPSYLQGSAENENSKWSWARLADSSMWVRSLGSELEKWIAWRMRSAMTGKAEGLRYSLNDSERKTERVGVCSLAYAIPNFSKSLSTLPGLRSLSATSPERTTLKIGKISMRGEMK